MTGTISKVTDLSKTAKEVTIALPEDLNFKPGSFINIFMKINGQFVRRAFSISSFDTVQNEISISIRLSPNGIMSPVFWQKDLSGETVELMGPLGLNTADKINAEKIILFGFGIGTGVAKSLLDHFVHQEKVKRIILMTGSRSEEDILHRAYFDDVALHDPRVEVRHVVSQPSVQGIFRAGYIQDHIDGIDFKDTDVYVCGQQIACDQLVEKINAQNPRNCSFFIEAFH